MKIQHNLIREDISWKNPPCSISYLQTTLKLQCDESATRFVQVNGNDVLYLHKRARQGQGGGGVSLSPKKNLFRNSESWAIFTRNLGN